MTPHHHVLMRVHLCHNTGKNTLAGAEVLRSLPLCRLASCVHKDHCSENHVVSHNTESYPQTGLVDPRSRTAEHKVKPRSAGQWTCPHLCVSSRTPDG